MWGFWIIWNIKSKVILQRKKATICPSNSRLLSRIISLLNLNIHLHLITSLTDPFSLSLHCQRKLESRSQPWIGGWEFPPLSYSVWSFSGDGCGTVHESEFLWPCSSSGSGATFFCFSCPLQSQIWIWWGNSHIFHSHPHSNEIWSIVCA